MKRVGLAVLLALTLPLIVAAAPRRSAVFKANAVHLFDAEGRVRVKLTVETGQPGLLLLDENGVVRTAHCALGWMRADARGKRHAAAGVSTCVPLVAEQPMPAKMKKKPLQAEEE